MSHSIRQTQARSILSPVSGFLHEAGFTHSLSPARNCTYGCSYCYVPTMRVFGGLRREDWTHWGEWTTFKVNGAELALRELRATQIIYCSPLVDPYQPAEAQAQWMPGLLESVCERPPSVFAIQTRGPLIERDVAILQRLARRTRLRISFSVTTDIDAVRRRYEPHCASNDERLRVIGRLREAGLSVYATLAPVLPCNPEELAGRALEASRRDLIVDPLHTRAAKKHGATTRKAAALIAQHWGETEWLDPEFQEFVVVRMRVVAERAGKRLLTGTTGFGLLSNDVSVDDDFAEDGGIDVEGAIRE